MCIKIGGKGCMCSSMIENASFIKPFLDAKEFLDFFLKVHKNKTNGRFYFNAEDWRGQKETDIQLLKNTE